MQRPVSFRYYNNTMLLYFFLYSCFFTSFRIDIALSLRGDANEIGVKALKLAIKYHLDQENVDYLTLRYE